MNSGSGGTRQHQRLARWSRLWLVAALIAGLALTILPAPAARAAGIVVNSTDDAANGTDGLCTLREAIGAANSNTASGAAAGECIAGSGPDTITFAAAVTGTITLTAGELVISTDLTITGPGANVLTVSGNNASRVFNVGGGTVAISGLTIANGLTADNVAGGINNSGTLTIANSVVRDNHSRNTPNNGVGGGITNTGTLTVSGSTISGNRIDGFAGGGGIGSQVGTVTVVNSTISGNTAQYGGGVFSNSSPIVLTNVTIVGNEGINGGGILAGNGPTTLTNTIVAASSGGANCRIVNGSIANGGNNLDDGTSCGFGTANGSLSSTDPKLGPLQANGGPTPTHALLPGSPAIDAADAATCANAPVNGVDQRGIPRPQGLRCDIGAFEVSPPNPAPQITGLATTPNPVAGGSGTIALTVNGTNFVQGFSTIAINGATTINGTAFTTTYVSPTQLTATLSAFPREGAGPYTVTVTNSAPGGGTSNPLTLTVTNPAPALTGLAPLLMGTSTPGTLVGSGGTALTLAGGNFAPGATVQFDGTTLTPPSVAATSITVTVPANLLTTARVAPVTVTNPGPGGGVSGAVNFTVANPAPALTGLSPSTATAGDGPRALTVSDTGNRFVAGSAIDFGGQRLDTTFVNAGQLTATIPASALRAAGDIPVRVVSPGPGGGPSAGSLTFVVNPAGANQLAIGGGNNQSTAVNTTFGTALAVIVRDQFGNPVAPGTTVTFTAPASGASGTFAGGVTTAQTDANGLATAPAFTANGVVGSYSVVASAGGGAVPFTLINTPGPAARLGVTAPANTVAGAPVPVTVTVRDAAGNVVPAYVGTVHFTSGDPQATLPADYTFVAGDGGTRTFTATLRTAGNQAITATDTVTPGITGTATDTVTPGITGTATVAVAPAAPTTLTATNGTPQSQPIGGTFAPLAATARDAFANPVPGVPVTFAAPVGGPGGTFPGGGIAVTVATDATGVATAPPFVANGVVGTYGVVASSGAGSATFALANTPGPATRLVVGTPGTLGGVAAGAPLTLTVTALDAGGNVATGYTGTVHLTSGDPQATLPADRTFTGADAGSATVTLTLRTAGPQTVTVTDTANGALVASTTVTVAATGAATIAAVGGTPQGAQVGTAFAAPLVAVVRDGSGNPLAGLSVTFTTPASGPSATFGGGHSAVAVTDATGVATAPALVANSTAGTYTVSTSATGVVAPATFALTNTAGAIPTANVVVTATGGGTVTPGSGSYAIGSTVAFTATADGTNIFLGWTVDGQFVGLANPLSLPITGARTVVATFAPHPIFSDVPTGSPAAEAIAQLAARGIIRGYGDGRFGPNDQTLRSQSAALIARAMGWEREPHGNLFPDKCDPNGQNCIDDELWNDVAALNFYNVARGYSDAGSCASAATTTPCYLPRVPVANVQVIAFITRAMVAKGYWQSAVADDPSLYPNVPSSSGHRLDLVTYARNAGAIPGQSLGGNFAGYDQPATRAFFAEALWQAYSAYFGTNRLP